jgi:hypothetical protein
MKLRPALTATAILPPVILLLVSCGGSGGTVARGAGQWLDDVSRAVGTAAGRQPVKPSLPIQNGARSLAGEAAGDGADTTVLKEGSKVACKVHEGLAPPWEITLEPDVAIRTKAASIREMLRRKEAASIDGKESVDLFCKAAG